MRWWKTVLVSLILMFSTVTALAQEDVITYTDGQLTFEYRAGWQVLHVEGRYYVTNNSDFAFPSQAASDALIGFIFLPGANLFGEPTEKAHSLDEALDLIIPAFCVDTPCGEHQYFDRKGTPALRVDTLIQQEEIDIQASLFVFQIGQETFIGVLFMGAAELMPEFEPDIKLITDSLKYKPAAAITAGLEFELLAFTREYSADGFNITYPETWALHFIDIVPYLANSPQLSETPFSAELGTEDVRIGMISPSMLDSVFGVNPLQSPRDVLKPYLEANLAQNPHITDITIGGQPAAVFHRPVNEITINALRYYAVQLESGHVMIFLVMTAPGSEDRFAGVLPYLLRSVDIDS